MTLISLLFSLLLILAALGSLAGLVLGAWLFLHPGANTLLDRPARDALEPLARPVRVERFVYRHHRWFGGVIVAGSMLTLAALGAYGQRLYLLGRAGSGGPLEHWLWESLLWFVALGNFFTLAAGCLILIRPSGLKGFEAWANRRVDPGWVRQALLTGLRNRPRLYGLLLASGGALALWLLARR
ncbi:MAG: hypothetical protein HQL96_16795 [Magnetococcales bacterium]|nr:hypothetical protein [Magnetococcales bacterium]